jgi:hypothetical protein
VTAPDWKSLLWETRGFLGLDEDVPVPRDELVEQAKANGWTEREIQEAIRNADALEFVGDLDDARVRLADVDETFPTEETESRKRSSSPDEETPDEAARPGTTYHDVDWSDVDAGVDPTGTHDYPHWMPTTEKKPWTPNAPTENTRSWSNPDNWVTAAKAAEWEEMHPEIDGRAFILQGEGDEQNYNGDPDPFLFVDFDDVADGDGTEPAPEAIELMDELGLTYTDYSTSGTGLHLIFRGSLPKGVRTIQFDLDDVGEVEIYDQRRVCIMTGKHVAEMPVEPQPVDEAVLEDLAEEHGKQTADIDREDWEPEFDREELSGMDETDDSQAIFDAIRQVEPRDVRLKSSKTEERPDGTLSFDPTWANSRSGKRLGWDPEIGWIYREGDIGLDVLQVIALEERIIHSETDYPQGQDWWDAVDALRDRGAPIPEFTRGEGTDGDPQPTSALPLAQLEALPHDQRRRAAKTRGLEWPTTQEARDRLFATITEVMRHEDTAVVDAPTSLGKSHTIATTAWNSESSLEPVTGGGPVIHLQATRDARDEAIEAAQEAGIDWFVLKSRHEACPVAAGDYDPPASGGDQEIDYTPITINGQPASEWLQTICDGRGIPFSAAHRHLEDHNDQGRDLPCCAGGTTYDEGDFEETPSECPAIAQWDTYRDRRDDLDVVFATHNFAHVPGLRMHTNLVIDEEPDFEADLDKQRVEEAITAYLQEIDAPVTNWESFITLSQYDGYGDDAAAEREALQSALGLEPPQEHYFEDPRAHTLAPALARAIFHAEERANGRRFGKTPHEPPRLDAGAVDEDAWNREWVSVVLTEDNELRSVRCAPDFSQARSVIGLDAWPARPKWMVNVHPDIQTKEVLEPRERQLWRRFERGLRVVQVGDATRPLASGEYFNPQQVRALFEHLVDEYGGDRIRTAITTNAVEGQLQQLMKEAGCVEPSTMHYGEEKSRNDFANEPVGVVNGSIDPGDDHVVDLLAELDLEAEPETVVDNAGEQRRAHGRGFDGPDADVAQAILASVRENHTAQAAGRYARDPDNPDSHATVFVRTDAMPTGFADIQTPGVEWVFSDLQREIVDALRSSRTSKTARELADDVGCSKEHVRKTLDRLVDRDHADDAVQAFEEAGDNGATLYSDRGAPNSGVVDLDGVANEDVWGSYTWSLAIRDPVTDPTGADQGSDDPDAGVSTTWNWREGADPPSDDD